MNTIQLNHTTIHFYKKLECLARFAFMLGESGAAFKERVRELTKKYSYYDNTL